jgi:hypothetical protein
MALYVQLNDPSKANGIIQYVPSISSSSRTNPSFRRLWHNGQKSVDFTNLVLRTSSAIPGVGGQMFSTFFGGSDQTWSTPKTQYTYYRQMAMYAGFGSSQSGGPGGVTVGQAAATAVNANASASATSTTSTTSSSANVPGPTSGALSIARLNGLACLITLVMGLAIII